MDHYVSLFFTAFLLNGSVTDCYVRGSETAISQISPLEWHMGSFLGFFFGGGGLRCCNQRVTALTWLLLLEANGESDRRDASPLLALSDCSDFIDLRLLSFTINVPVSRMGVRLRSRERRMRGARLQTGTWHQRDRLSNMTTCGWRMGCWYHLWWVGVTQVREETGWSWWGKPRPQPSREGRGVMRTGQAEGMKKYCHQHTN